MSDAVAVALLVGGAVLALPVRGARVRRFPPAPRRAGTGRRAGGDAAGGPARWGRLRRFRAGPGSGGVGHGVVAEPDEALLLDLVAAALLAGAPTTAALAVAGTAAGGGRGTALRTVSSALLLGASADEAWPDDVALTRLRRCLELSARSGVPAVPLLRAAADTTRRERHRAGERAAARLGVRLALPLGLCAVPAFVAWGVVPVVLSLARQVGQ